MTWRNIIASRSHSTPHLLDRVISFLTKIVTKKTALYDPIYFDDTAIQPPLPISDPADSLTDVEKALNSLSRHKEFQRLANKVDRDLLLTPRRGILASEINEYILEKFYLFQHGKEVNRQDVTFDLAWDPTSFLKEQQIEDEPTYDDLGKVLVIIGSNIDAQATSCAHYMDQTWPLTGSALLDILQRSLNVKYGGTYECK